MHKQCPSKAKTYENNLKKLYDFCIPNDLHKHNLLIIIVLGIGGIDSYLLRRNFSKKNFGETSPSAEGGEAGPPFKKYVSHLCFVE